MKRRGDRIVMITAYDAPSGRIADDAGVDVILVGDSAAMVVLGHDSTVPATMDELIILTRAVNRGARRPLVVADMPFGSFQVSNEQALENAIRFVKEAGADAVKLEGAGPMLPRVRALTGAGVPVMGHIGLTPQTATMLGGFKAQGRTAAKARAALRGRARAPGGRLLRDRPRGGADPGRRGDHRGRSRSRRSASAPAPAATARCSCGTTCWGSTKGTHRASSSSTPSSRPSCSRRSRSTPARCATARSPQQQHTYSIPEEELALFEEALAEVRAG